MEKMNNRKNAKIKNRLGKALFAACFLFFGPQYAFPIEIGNVQVDPDTNNVRITMTNLPVSQNGNGNSDGNDDILLKVELFKQTEDGEWKKDDGTFVTREIRAITSKEKFLNLKWNCGNPESLASKFLIKITDEKGNKVTRTFEVANPNLM